ncbi:Hypothetical predicted protein [Podarcis lilfordi]|nr:Hypothetical predicted protein [Podarcis lilfordi]
MEGFLSEEGQRQRCGSTAFREPQKWWKEPGSSAFTHELGDSSIAVSLRAFLRSLTALSLVHRVLERLPHHPRLRSGQKASGLCGAGRAMRSVSYVRRVTLEFGGSLFPRAVCLGDADNDALNELVVGDTSGKLFIYKSDESKPWNVRLCQGMLTCVGVGDVCNKGKNVVVAVSAEGWFHLFDLTPSTKHLDASGHHELPTAEDQKLGFKQHIPANTKVMLISDIDGDGKSELVVGYTDRVVRAFRWEDTSESSENITGQLVLLKKWLLEGQVDSLSVNPGSDCSPEMMVSQPGCGYAVLLCTWKTEQQSPTERIDSSAASR